jgi:hypothetical protein
LDLLLTRFAPKGSSGQLQQSETSRCKLPTGNLLGCRCGGCSRVEQQVVHQGAVSAVEPHGGDCGRRHGPLHQGGLSAHTCSLRRERQEGTHKRRGECVSKVLTLESPLRANTKGTALPPLLQGRQFWARNAVELQSPSCKVEKTHHIPIAPEAKGTALGMSFPLPLPLLVGSGRFLPSPRVQKGNHLLTAN